MNDSMYIKVCNEVPLPEKDVEIKRKLFLMTVLIFVFILIGSATIITRNIKRNELYEETGSTVAFLNIENSQINQGEKELLSMLQNVVGNIELSEQNSKVSNPYIDILYQYFSRPGIDLSISIVDTLKKEIVNLNSVIQTEGTNNLKQMTIDGRSVAICLFEKIYHECDLTIHFDETNAIQNIVDSQGHLLYGQQTKNTREQINMSVGIIILSALIGLITLCYLVSNKKQIFIKEVPNDGLNENEFA